MGAGRTPRACTPARRRDRGSKGQGGRGGGGSPGLHKRIAVVEALPVLPSARKVGETAPAGPGSSGTSPLPARGAEPHRSSVKKRSAWAERQRRPLAGRETG